MGLILSFGTWEGSYSSFNDFRTGLNSGYCALQLAILLGYEKIYLLGIDLNPTSSTHYHKGYGTKIKRFHALLLDYFKHFKEGLEQIKKDDKGIEVISCSPTSKLNSIIQYQNIEEVLCI